MRNRLATALACLLCLCAPMHTAAQPRPDSQAATPVIQIPAETGEVAQEIERLVQPRPGLSELPGDREFYGYFQQANSRWLKHGYVRGPISARRMLNPVRYKLLANDEDAGLLVMPEQILCQNNDGPLNERPFVVTCSRGLVRTLRHFPCRDGSFDLRTWARNTRCHGLQIETRFGHTVKLNELQPATPETVFQAGAAVMSSDRVRTIPQVTAIRHRMDSRLNFTPAITPTVLASFHAVETARTGQIAEQLMQQAVRPIPTDGPPRIQWRESRSAVKLNYVLGTSNALALLFGLALFFIQQREVRARDQRLRLAQATGDRSHASCLDLRVKVNRADQVLADQHETLERREADLRRQHDELKSRFDALSLGGSSFEIHSQELEEQLHRLQAEHGFLQTRFEGQTTLYGDLSRAHTELQAENEDLRHQLQIQSEMCQVLQPKADALEAARAAISNRHPELSRVTLAEAVKLLVAEGYELSGCLESSEIHSSQTRDLLKDRDDRIGRANLMISQMVDGLRPLLHHPKLEPLTKTLDSLCSVFVGLKTYRNVPRFTGTIRPPVIQAAPVIVEDSSHRREELSRPRGDKENTGSFEINLRGDEVARELGHQSSEDSWTTDTPTDPRRRRSNSSSSGGDSSGSEQPARAADEPTPSGIHSREVEELLPGSEPPDPSADGRKP